MNPDSLRLVLPVLVFMILMVLIFWSTVIRPQANASRRHQQLIKDIQPGDQVVTAGGMHGTVVAVAEDTFVLEIAPDVRVTFDRRAVIKKLE